MPGSLLLLFFVLRTVARETVEQGRMGRRRTVGAMDGAIEPPWMGLRRVLHGPAYPRHAGTINAPQRPLLT
ncbi:hypothetical protein A9J40_08090 [Stenotrophomonas maltophilia]|nr:hypothetical protein A9K70_04215 [Stenotrophomonas maltophilia]OBU67110.1 hypothetical protein A9J40_08090 [Stenotrophomonas maltophilia]QCZ98361.1 hypothetical protein DL544_17345 [Stenotrophomonas sp. pho]